MTSDAVVRWSGVAGVLAGLMYAATGIVDRYGPLAPRHLVSFSDYLLQFIFALALVSTLVVVLGLHALQSQRYGWTGTLGSIATFIGHVLFIYVTVETVVGGSSVSPDPQQVGLLAILVGLALLGIATLAARVLPHWCGVLLILGYPLSVALGVLGGSWLIIGTLLGIFWVSVGYALSATSSGVPTRQPTSLD